MIVAIPAGLIHTWWPSMVGGLKKLLDKGTVPYTTDEIQAGLYDGSWLLFAAVEEEKPVCWWIGRIHAHVLELGLCWGSGMDKWLDYSLATFEQLARDAGCNKISIGGRPGWVKLGKSRGFNVKSITIVKEL